MEVVHDDYFIIHVYDENMDKRNMVGNWKHSSCMQIYCVANVFSVDIYADFMDIRYNMMVEVVFIVVFVNHFSTIYLDDYVDDHFI